MNNLAQSIFNLGCNINRIKAQEIETKDQERERFIKDAPFTRERCLDLWQNHGPECDVKCTKEEDDYIRNLWDLLDGSRCFMSAFFRIYNYKVLGKMNNSR